MPECKIKSPPIHLDTEVRTGNFVSQIQEQVSAGNRIGGETLSLEGLSLHTPATQPFLPMADGDLRPWEEV